MALVFLIAAFAMAGAAEAKFTDPGGGGETPNHFHGRVTDETGSRIAGARVMVFYKGYNGVCCVVDYTFTRSDGTFILYPTIVGQGITYNFEVSGPNPTAVYLAPGRWPDRLYFTGYWTHDRARVGIGVTNFVLPRNGPASFLDFVHLSTPGYSTFSVSYTKSHVVRVYCLGCGPFGLGFDYTWSSSTVVAYTSRQGAASIARRNWVMSTGVLRTDAWESHPQVDMAWLYGSVTRQEILDSVGDAMGPVSNPSMPDQTLPPGFSLDLTHTESSSALVGVSIEVSVGLSLPGGSISASLSMGYSTQDSSSYTSRVTILNTDSVTRTFRVYYENNPTYGLVTHVWRL